MHKADAQGLFRMYLRDHHAAGTAGSSIARRLAANVTLGDQARKELAEVAADIRADLRTLEDVMAAEEITRDATKDLLARVGAAVGKLKLNGRIRSRSPLSDVLELETLLAGVSAKAALWATLKSVPLRTNLDLDGLSVRADEQSAILARWRDSASSHAFGSTD